MTSDELRDERKRRRLTQEEMAALLNNTSPSTYRKWEQGVTDEVPDWVERELAPKKISFKDLSLEEISEISQLARENNSNFEDYLVELLRMGKEAAKKAGKTSLSILLFGLVAWQAFAPADSALVRKFGGRRRQEYGEVLEIGDADA